MKTKFLKIIMISTAGVGGWIAGSNYERLRHSPFKFATIYSAEPTTDIVPEAVPIENNKSLTINRTNQIMRFGFPGLDQLRALDDYVLSYDRRNRTAHWVFEHLTRENIKKKGSNDRTLCSFKEDTSIHRYFRATNEDYKGSGYDRGHLAAAGNRRSQESCDQTFLLSNIAPQVGKGFNRDAWNKLEKYVRRLTKYYKNVYVCTGPLYLPRKEADGKIYVKYQVIGKNNVAVPTHFFKVVVGETETHNLEMEAYVMPNAVIDDNVSIFSYQVPLDSIERVAGLLFFEKIPQNAFKRINGRKFAFKEDAI